MAEVISAKADNLSAIAIIYTPYELINCVPLRSANPSFDCNSTGIQPNFLRIKADSDILPLYSTSPIPRRGSTRCASGARSPEAPRDPCSYTTGVIPSLKKSINRCIVATWTPDFPRLRACTFRSSMSLIISSLTIGPIPHACDLTRFSWSLFS